MNAYNAIRAAADASGMSLAAVSRAIGRSNDYITAGAARGSDPSTANAAAMLGACGYALVALPANAVPPDALRIDAAPPKADQLNARRERLQADMDALDALAAGLTD